MCWHQRTTCGTELFLYHVYPRVWTQVSGLASSVFNHWAISLLWKLFLFHVMISCNPIYQFLKLFSMLLESFSSITCLCIFKCFAYIFLYHFQDFGFCIKVFDPFLVNFCAGGSLWASWSLWSLAAFPDVVQQFYGKDTHPAFCSQGTLIIIVIY